MAELYFDRRRFLAWLTVTAAVGVALGVADAQLMVLQVVGATLGVLCGISVFRAVDNAEDPRVSVPLWRVGYRQRRWPQLIERTSAKRR